MGRVIKSDDEDASEDVDDLDEFHDVINESDDEMEMAIVDDVIDDDEQNSDTKEFKARQRERTTPRKRKDSRKRGLHEGVEGLKRVSTLEDKHSFYVETEPILTRVNDNSSGNQNIVDLLNEIKRIHTYLVGNFDTCSGVYVGKTTKMRFPERFSMHRKKAGTGECVIMVSIAELQFVPQRYIDDFFGDSETLALAYERRLIGMLKDYDIPIYNQNKKERMEKGGGGKMASVQDVGCVYVLCVVGKNKKV